MSENINIVDSPASATTIKLYARLDTATVMHYTHTLRILNTCTYITLVAASQKNTL